MKKLVILIAVIFGQHLYAQTEPDIVRFEYFFIEVSGDTLVGDTTKVPITAGPDLTVNLNIGLNPLSDTLSYHLHLYGVDEDGVPSLQHIDTTSLALEVVREKRVAAKVFLQGPYKANGDTMSTEFLNPAGGPLLIPLTSPYAEDPRSVTSIPADIVDWVLVELRDDTTGSAVADTSAFLHKDGRIVADDGTTNDIILTTTSDSANFFIVIRHRNHLSIMSSSEQLLSDAFSILYDFTTAQNQAFGTNPMKQLEAGVFGMYTGDANGDDGVDGLDFGVWFPQNGNPWNYTTTLGDFNLDAGVDGLDFGIWFPNNGTGTQVPLPLP